MPPKKPAPKKGAPAGPDDLTTPVPLQIAAARRVVPRSAFHAGILRLHAASTRSGVIYRGRLWLAGLTPAWRGGQDADLDAATPAPAPTPAPRESNPPTPRSVPAAGCPAHSPPAAVAVPADIRRRLAVSRQLLRQVRPEQLDELRGVAMPPVWVRDCCHCVGLLTGALGVPFSEAREGQELCAAHPAPACAGLAFPCTVVSRDEARCVVRWREGQGEEGPPEGLRGETAVPRGQWDAVLPLGAVLWRRLRIAAAARGLCDRAAALTAADVSPAAAAEARRAVRMRPDSFRGAARRAWGDPGGSGGYELPRGAAAAGAVLAQWAAAQAGACIRNACRETPADSALLPPRGLLQTPALPSGPVSAAPAAPLSPTSMGSAGASQWAHGAPQSRPHTAPARLLCGTPLSAPSRAPSVVSVAPDGARLFPQLTELAAPSGLRVAQVAGGDAHVLVLSADHILVSFGSNRHGQLGRPTASLSLATDSPAAISLTPSTATLPVAEEGMHAAVPIPFFRRRRVLQIACGAEHSLVLCAKDLKTTPALFRSHTTSLRSAATAERAAPDPEGGITPVQSVGGSNVPCTGVGNQLFSFGNGRCGQLGVAGLKGVGDSVEPRELKQFSVMEVVSLHAGGNCSMVVTRQGVWAFGDNRVCQLGIPQPLSRVRTPQLVPELAAASAADAATAQGTGYVFALGGYHTIALIPGVGVLGMGSSTHGELALVNADRSGAPAVVHGLPPGCVGAACGRGHTLLWLRDGTALACGANQHGQLGVGDTSDRAIPSRVLLPKGARCLSAAAGAHHTIFLTTHGLYACGRNQRCQLGLPSAPVWAADAVCAPQPLYQFNYMVVPYEPPPPPPPPPKAEPPPPAAPPVDEKKKKKK
eukprot:TRINITY_DN4995_c0_g1_i1.p1 TRINITY_DN4995_c0_g1~~TRINITY_DN4995_c0_g1_i1.p1  ORF type:complete len:898 (+),score=238.55 TRINITY_DN4995_c0_g1_i1:74-2695(+)